MINPVALNNIINKVSRSSNAGVVATRDVRFRIHLRMKNEN